MKDHEWFYFYRKALGKSPMGLMSWQCISTKEMSYILTGT